MSKFGYKFYYWLSGFIFYLLGVIVWSLSKVFNLVADKPNEELYLGKKSCGLIKALGSSDIL